MFGGEVHGDTLLISEYHGVRTGGLRGLAVRSNSGLGGASMVAGRPLAVADYRTASSITHDYDGPVLSEGIRSVLAVPVLVDGRARAMLYGAYRTGAPFGGRAADLVVEAAQRLSDEIRIRDEVDRRLRWREAHLANNAAVSAEQIREVHAELRQLAVSAPAALQDRLRVLADKLSGDDDPDPERSRSDTARARRPRPGGARLHQFRSGPATLVEARNRQELFAQRRNQTRGAHAIRIGVQGPTPAVDPLDMAKGRLQRGEWEAPL